MVMASVIRSYGRHFLLIPHIICVILNVWLWSQWIREGFTIQVTDGITQQKSGVDARRYRIHDVTLYVNI